MTEEKPTPEPVCWIVTNGENAFLTIDSLGMLWTSHAPNAYGFKSEARASRFIASRFAPIEVENRKLRAIDVSTWAARPARCMGE